MSTVALLVPPPTAARPPALRSRHPAFLQRSCKLGSSRVTAAMSSSDPSLATEAPQAAVTSERRLNPDLQEQLAKPYLARAMSAVDPSHPEGSKGRDSKGMSVLQQHAAFFDRNGDGVIYPWETFQSLRAIGLGSPSAFGTSILLHLVLTYPTQPGWMPSPLLSIHIKNIHRGKHGSDSETYDTEGSFSYCACRFEPAKFDAIFSKFGKTRPNALSEDEINAMLKHNRNMYDFLGWAAANLEWKLLHKVAKDKEGFLQREIVRGAFDGSLFERLQESKKST
ncbi:unnamed protein product [Triticum turgidum subsp. durum]|uniref:Caleosin n=1 Tax=Triticum turgidum subsp. durum TaxID=4567 RepID=A0A9R0S8A1_TRITD|nr:unnamed protein product [Triticum turgidum subsp. durum]